MITSDSIVIPQKALTTYFQRIQKKMASNIASERSYYPYFSKLLEEIFPPSDGFQVIIEPLIPSQQRNIPDFAVLYNHIPIFRVEAKKPRTGIEGTISSEKQSHLKEQIVKYRKLGSQLLITDFLNIWLVQTEVDDASQINLTKKCTLIQESQDGSLHPVNSVQPLQDFLLITCAKSLKTIDNVKLIIRPLAIIAKDIRKDAMFLLNSDFGMLSSVEKIGATYLRNILADFRNSIFKGDVPDENGMFSDLFAQTMVYGTFSAWIHYCQDRRPSSNFSLNVVREYLPYGSFLRDIFLYLKDKTPKTLQQHFQRIEAKFRITQFEPFITNVESLITTFYSDFLKLYDPETAKNRGVVYTPFEIVSFMVDGIDQILIDKFKKPDGILSSTHVNSHSIDLNRASQLKQLEILKKPEKIKINCLRILDPAAGTMAFASGLLHKARAKFYGTYPNQSNIAELAFDNWVKTEFFPNMYAFEILMAPYILGSMRIFLTLNSFGVKLNQEEFHLNSFLMNTLMTPPKQENLDEYIFNNQEIGNEIKTALKIRDKQNIYIVMGNPPYNLSSQNDCEWINEKIQDYKQGLHEKNLKILSDDYVKFIRFAQWKIERVGKGIVSFITNSRYLDGQMFSIMRKSLRTTFDEIYIVNLHGDMRKKEPGNVFDIRVGVAICFLIRYDNKPNKSAKVYYQNIPHESKLEKYMELAKGFQFDVFQELAETPKNYFVPIDTTLLHQFNSFPCISSFFLKQPRSGIMAGKDHLVMDSDESVLAENLRSFFENKFDLLNARKIKINDTKSWQKETVFTGTSVKNCLDSIKRVRYRGFDYKYITYDRTILEGHRMGYIDQISNDNLAITVSKSSRKPHFSNVLISNQLIEKCYLSVTDTSYAFLAQINGESNIIKPDLSFSISDRQLFGYIYGILFSPLYRSRYEAYLLKNFPRIPLVNNEPLFLAMSKLGQRLVDLHLLDVEISPHFEISDRNTEWKIKQIHYDADQKKVFFDKSTINEDSPWIKGITPTMWAFEIGSIQQIEQFLKSRRYHARYKWNGLQRGLSYDELTYFLKMCTAIKYTIDLLPEIDTVYSQIDRITLHQK